MANSKSFYYLGNFYKTLWTDEKAVLVNVSPLFHFKCCVEVWENPIYYLFSNLGSVTRWTEHRKTYEDDSCIPGYNV